MTLRSSHGPTWVAAILALTTAVGLVGGMLNADGADAAGIRRGRTPSATVTATATASPSPTGTPGGGEDEEAGNNLSFPAIWSDGVTLPLRGTYGAPVFAGAFTVLDGIPWYHQQDEGNSWQAETATGVGAPFNVDWVDWGDNLEARSWTLQAPVRVETVLYQDAPMDSFEMRLISGQGVTEMWGTSGNVLESPQATVYSACARITIQKLTTDPTDPTFEAVWDPARDQWVGDLAPALVNKGVWETAEGAQAVKYAAEINVSGKLIYGFNWNTKTLNNGAGMYRITFSLDGTGCPTTLNTFFDGDTEIVPSAEEETIEAAAETTGGGVAVMDSANNLSYIDITLTSATGRRGGR